MHPEPSESRGGAAPRLERAIILQLLRADREASWSRDELLMELGGEMPPLEAALVRLQDDGVLSIAHQQVSASAVARRLDDLGLIGV
jgi:hypothetical protein